MRRLCRCILPTIALLAVGQLLGGCIYRSKVEDREFRTPQSFSQQNKRDKAARSRVGRWWKLFGDAQLDRLVSAAFTHNLDLEVARARLDQSRARLMGATAGWYPSITGQAEASRSQTVFNAPDPIGAREFRQTNLQLSLSASYELDVWGKVRYARKAAKHALAASEEQLRAAHITLAASVADAYYMVVQQRMQLELLDRTIDNRKRQVQLVRERYHSGVARPADLYQAQQSLAQSRAQRAGVLAVLRIAEHALAIVVGRYPGEIDPGRLDELPAPIRELTPGVPAQLLLQRPDLRAAHQSLLAVDAQVGAALAEHFPSLTVGASIGGRFDPTGLIWSLLAQLTAPVFQGGRIRAQYKEKQALLRENVAVFKKTLLTAVKEVEDALVNSRALVRRIKWLEQRVTALEGALRLSIDQYVQGLSGYLDVLASEQSLFVSRTELIAARRDLIAARISLARAMGGSWVDQHIASAATPVAANKDP